MRNIFPFMKKIGCLLLGLFIFFTSNTLAKSESSASVAMLLEINSSIGPASQAFFRAGLNAAIAKNADFMILQLNTPGGLDTAMRGIVSEILSSPIPIVAYVAPSGARAASAGTYIVYASHIAAMAPGTNMGAATPFVHMHKDRDIMMKKVTNDALAYLRGLAELRHRDIAWGEKAITQSASLSANEALKTHVIEFVANDVTDLLKKIDGYSLILKNKPITLQTKNITLEQVQPNLHTRFLNVVTDPNIAYILLIVGVWGLFFEFMNPGFVLPGVTGAIALLIALYAFQLLPVNYAGFALVILGICFMLAEAFLMCFGICGIGGVVAFIIGSIMLLEQAGPLYSIALPLIFSVSIITALFFLITVHLIVRSQLKPIVSGKEALLGCEGHVVKDNHGLTRIRVQGELWQVHAITPLHAGQKVKVIGIEGVILLVEPSLEKK